LNLTQFKETKYYVNKLVEDIHRGEIGLPELQRPFVWPSVKVRDLFDSMYKGFPVGYLLLWVNGAEEHSRQIGTNQKLSIPRLLVIDGQQRLTALYAIIKGQLVLTKDFVEKRIEIAFNPLDNTFEVADAAICKDPSFIANISDVWSPETDIFEVVEKYSERLGNTRDLTDQDISTIKKSLQKLHGLTNYPFTALELDSNLNEEQVSDVFVRINSKGTRLNQADFVLTLMSVFWEEGRKQLEKFSRNTRIPSSHDNTPYNYFLEPDPDDLLRVNVALGFRRAALHYFYPLLRGKDMETGTYSDVKREEQFGKLKAAQVRALDLQNWKEFFKSIIKAGYRRGKYITSKMGLVYTYAIFLIGKTDFKLEPHRLRRLIARWFFMEALTGRYTNSPESQMESDMGGLRGLNNADDFEAHLEKIIHDTLTEDFWNIGLPNLLHSSAGWSPALYAYYASLNLLEAKVLYSETEMKVSDLMDPVSSGKRSSLERHHLFPKNYLKKIGITGTKEINQIANYALVEWHDNKDILDKSPTEYVPRYEEMYSVQQLEKLYDWHALPLNWCQMEYGDFLERRRVLMAKIIRNGFDKLS